MTDQTPTPDQQPKTTAEGQEMTLEQRLQRLAEELSAMREVAPGSEEPAPEGRDMSELLSRVQRLFP